MSKQDLFFSTKIQEIQAKLDGRIIHSSDTLFEISLTENIFELHPFFESLKAELQNSSDFNKSMAFPCVNLDRNGKEIICDITIKKDRGYIAILLFDYSKHYEHLNEAALEKKTAILNEQKHNLTQLHQEEKKEYLGFIKDRIENKMIRGIEKIIEDIDTLKNTELKPEQLVQLDLIKHSVGNFHMKAVQIKNDLDFDFDA